MDAQIKEEAKDPSLYFETSEYDISSKSLIEKYDLYLQNEQLDTDSDGEFFSDDDLKEQYAQFRSGSSNRATGSNHRLSTGLPAKYRNIDQHLLVVDEESTNGTDKGDTPNDVKLEYDNLNQLIEKLESHRTCGDDGNSIFCTESELETIQEDYGKILDFISEKASNFEKSSGSKDLSAPSSVNQISEPEQNNLPIEVKNQQTLEAKMTAVRLARDRFYEVESQVKEQLEQLELVERYKMESVG